MINPKDYKTSDDLIAREWMTNADLWLKKISKYGDDMSSSQDACRQDAIICLERAVSALKANSYAYTLIMNHVEYDYETKLWTLLGKYLKDHEPDYVLNFSTKYSAHKYVIKCLEQE